MADSVTDGPCDDDVPGVASPVAEPVNAEPRGDDDPPGTLPRTAARAAGPVEAGDTGVAPPVPVPPGRGGPQRIPRPAGARAGGPPPWGDLPAAGRRPTVADVRRALADQGPAVAAAREVSGLVRRPAAVVAPLYDDPVAGAVVVLTRRTWSLRSHKGEVSFPGGRVEAGETPVEGALRETHEEIGVVPAMCEVIGELDHLATVTSGSFVVPLVGVLAGRPDTVANPAEVAAVLHVPLAELLDPAVYREERWAYPGGDERAIYFFELVGDTLWGATAAMLRQLLGMVTGTLGRGDLGHL